MALVISKLSNTLIEKFWIESVINNIHWWQKNVFIVKLKTWEIRVLKIFRDNSERDEREIEINNKFTWKANIPQIFEDLIIENERIILEEFINWKTVLEKSNEFIWNSEKIISLIKELITNMAPFRESGIIHRDIKPDNLIISNEWKLYIIDFWIAKVENLATITTTGFQPNTLPFASPEQIQWKKDLISYRTDFFCIWSLAYYLYYWEFLLWDDPQKINENLSKRIIKYREDCEDLNAFFNATLKYAPAERARNWNDLLNLFN